ncbi:unnamed protein product [Peronospora destructor]|uniref:Helicase C-terminal domain-containing protein n=1 Tax=Peronospora destructor TaxID=86335 RepID=A0AAV0VCA9_9STRA|nr:unnamed protein product [Peronospora destructor]
MLLENSNPNPNQNSRHGRRVNQIQQLVNQDQQRDREGQEPRRHGRNPRRGHEASGQNRHQEPRRALDLTRDIHFIDASKAFYAATRIKELKKEFSLGTVTPSGRSSRRQARYLKAIIFSQFKEHIWHTKVAFAQQGVPTADFIAGLTPKMRMKQLIRFRKDSDVNVLLLTEVGSHGLDLSFVTHIFLMDEIWDKSLEEQVISRAHRMGAGQAVVVEQLWMRGSVESQMLRPCETDDRVQPEEDRPEVLASPAQLRVHEVVSPGRSPKKPNTGGGKMFAASSKKRKRHRTNGSDAQKALKGNKNTELQRKLDYVLNNLRLLGEDIVAEPGEVRFHVENEHKEVIRRAIHVMPNRGTRASTNLTASTELPVTTVVTAPTVQTAVRRRPRVRRVVTFKNETLPSSSPHIPVRKRSAPADISVIDNFSDEESKVANAEALEDKEETMMMENDRRHSAKQRSVIAILSSSDDDNEAKPLPLLNDERCNEDKSERQSREGVQD